jgi:hypothetical protein
VVSCDKNCGFKGKKKVAAGFSLRLGTASRAPTKNTGLTATRYQLSEESLNKTL